MSHRNDPPLVLGNQTLPLRDLLSRGFILYRHRLFAAVLTKEQVQKADDDTEASNYAHDAEGRPVIATASSVK
jgi:hypothetical protein